jgi:hypothetical protein
MYHDLCTLLVGGNLLQFITATAEACRGLVREVATAAKERIVGSAKLHVGNGRHWTTKSSSGLSQVIYRYKATLTWR